MADRPKLTLESAQEAYRRENGKCAGCGANAREWHHVFPQQKWPEFADDPRNVIAVCVSCHTRHTDAFQRLPRRVCRHAEALADPRMLDYLERTYG